jgi:hypothetical protein
MESCTLQVDFINPCKISLDEINARKVLQLKTLLKVGNSGFV